VIDVAFLAPISVARAARFILACASVACLNAPLHAIPGQPGTLHASWATLSPLGAGKLITSIGANNDVGYAVALQPDGKVIVVGVCEIAGTSNDVCLARFTANGVLDDTFDGDGLVTTALQPTFSPDYGRAVLVQPDGRIVVAGACGGTTQSMCGARYLTNGTLDSSFGSGGIAITNFPGYSYAYAFAAALQPDGKIVFAGQCGFAISAGLVLLGSANFVFAQASFVVAGPACSLRESETCNARLLLQGGCTQANRACIGTGIPDNARVQCTPQAQICPPAPPCPAIRPPGVPCPPAPPCYTPSPRCPPITPATYAPSVCECAPTCSSSRQCASGKACASGHCRAIACNSSADCRAVGTPCIDGLCQIPPNMAAPRPGGRVQRRSDESAVARLVATYAISP
jgi:uncharacterized delta-60 repeat protein